MYQSHARFLGFADRILAVFVRVIVQWTACNTPLMLD